MPSLLVRLPVAMFLVTTSIGIISTFLIAISLSESTCSICVLTPFFSKISKSSFDILQFSAPFPSSLPFLRALKAVKSSLNSAIKTFSSSVLKIFLPLPSYKSSVLFIFTPLLKSYFFVMIKAFTIPIAV